MRETPGESTEAQIERLPQHAQLLIARLRRELDDARKHVAEVEAELSPPEMSGSPVQYNRPGDIRHRPLPPRAYLHFKVGVGWVRVMIQEDRNGDTFLDVNADQSLYVAPTATNSIRLRHVERFNS